MCKGPKGEIFLSPPLHACVLLRIKFIFKLIWRKISLIYYVAIQIDHQHNLLNRSYDLKYIYIIF